MRVMPGGGAVWPAMVRNGSVMRSSCHAQVDDAADLEHDDARPRRGDAPRRSEPGPLAASVVTRRILPPRPPGVCAAQPWAPGKASAVPPGHRGRRRRCRTPGPPAVSEQPAGRLQSMRTACTLQRSPCLALRRTSSESRRRLSMTPVSYTTSCDGYRQGIDTRHERRSRPKLAATTAPRSPGAWSLRGARPVALPGVSRRRCPRDLDEGYACQDAAIALWPDSRRRLEGGLHAGRTGEASWARSGWSARSSPAPCRRRAPASSHVRGDSPAASPRSRPSSCSASAPTRRPTRPTGRAEEAAALVDAAARRRRDWPAARCRRSTCWARPIVVSDFGNNAGLILGPEIPDWRRAATDDAAPARPSSTASGRPGRRGSHQRRPARRRWPSRWSRCARRGHPLQRGHAGHHRRRHRHPRHRRRPARAHQLRRTGRAALRCRAGRRRRVRGSHA